MADICMVEQSRYNPQLVYGTFRNRRQHRHNEEVYIVGWVVLLRCVAPIDVNDTCHWQGFADGTAGYSAYKNLYAPIQIRLY